MDDIIYWIILISVPLGFLIWCLICIAQGQEYKTDQYILTVAPYSPDAKKILADRQNGSYPYRVTIPRAAMPEYWKQYGYDPGVPRFRREWNRLQKRKKDNH